MRNKAECIGGKALVLVITILLPRTTAIAQDTRDGEWPYYGHDAGGMRYSSLTQINRENVSKLKVAWVFHTGDVQNSRNGSKRSGLETTPILVDGTLYLTTAFNRVIALDPATGKQLWVYDPKLDRNLEYGDGLVNRGAATWLDTSRSVGQPCRRRIFEAIQDARLIALDAGPASLAQISETGGKSACEMFLDTYPGGTT
jgi:quinoprotein glucose dehydrogenase